jgi:ribosomal protein S6
MPLPIFGLKIQQTMNTAPQQVTERYVTNLINQGRNREFDVVDIRRLWNKVEGVNVGTYYEAYVELSSASHQENGFGATISQAVRNALIKHGVTLR